MGSDRPFDIFPPLEREKYLPYHGQYETSEQDSASSNILQWWSTGVDTGIPTKAEESLVEAIAAWEEAEAATKRARGAKHKEASRPAKDNRRASLRDLLHGEVKHLQAYETHVDARSESKPHTSSDRKENGQASDSS